MKTSVFIRGEACREMGHVVTEVTEAEVGVIELQAEEH